MKFSFAILLCLSITTISCSQTGSTKPQPDVFVGSTPCDSFIKAVLQIPANEVCDFVKWQLDLDKNADSFHLSILHGESQPNTNGFKDGGKRIITSGTFKLTQNTHQDTGLPVYQLVTNNFTSPLFLVQMDTNVFHLADNNRKLLVGNGGWGYVLNKEN
jgi:hypothetical protein